MTLLILAVLFFVGIHLFISGTTLRDTLVSKIGEKPYTAFFSMLSFIGLGWMIWAYGRAPNIELWGQIYAWRWLSSLLILVAFLFIVLGLFTPSPTAVGGEKLLQKEDPAIGILRITRHPFLIGFALWACTHIAYNGDLSSLIFFSSFLILSVFGPKSIDNKQRRSCGDAWQRFADKTSILPFMANLQGRNRLDIKELGWWRIALALVIYIAMFKLHAMLFDVAPVVQGL